MILFSFSSFIFSQSLSDDFDYGYIISKSGERIVGSIKRTNFQTRFIYIDFKNKGTEHVRRLKPEDISGYNIKGENYTSGKAKYEEYKYEETDLFFHFFLKLLQRGNLKF